ncbi:MAG TPA: hypothetical protein VHD91_03145 [Gaiellaceae bacterium]|nr:hypothetical protein [Gaiellaceae bacterium]
MQLLALTAHNGERLAEIGEALLAIGGVLLWLGASLPFGRKGGNFLGGVALAASGVLLVIATHWGHFG